MFDFAWLFVFQYLFISSVLKYFHIYYSFHQYLGKYCIMVESMLLVLLSVVTGVTYFANNCFTMNIFSCASRDL